MGLKIQSNLFTTPATLTTEESGRYGEVGVQYDNFFFREYNMFIATSSYILNVNVTFNIRAIRIKFHDHSRLFHQSSKNLAVFERLFWQLLTRFSGRCRCREV